MGYLSDLIKSIFAFIFTIFLVTEVGLKGNEISYSLNRYAYPAFCELHFDNNIATAYTWLVADSQNILSKFESFLKYIPNLHS